MTGLDDGGETGATGTHRTDRSDGATGDTQPEADRAGAARKLGRLFALESSADEFERVGEFNAKLKRGQQETLDLIHIEKPPLPLAPHPERPALLEPDRGMVGPAAQ